MAWRTDTATGNAPPRLGGIYVRPGSTKKFDLTRPMTYERKRGCLSQRKVRKVCETHCNNGWMPRAVDAAKPTAYKLILGRSCSCDEAEQRKLTTWLAIATIMQEYIAPDSVFIPAEDRTTLMNTGIPPADWTIWIGH